MHLSRKVFVGELQQRHSANKQRGGQVAADSARRKLFGAQPGILGVRAHLSECLRGFAA